MSNRSWFFASQGKQQGPYPEAQLRDFIANGTVTAETLVWTEGMAGWQKAGEIPGLLSGAAGSPVVPGAGAVSASGAPAGGPLSVDFGCGTSSVLVEAQPPDQRPACNTGRLIGPTPPQKPAAHRKQAQII